MASPSLLSWWSWLLSFESASEAKSNDTNLGHQLEAFRTVGQYNYDELLLLIPRMEKFIFPS